MVCSAADSQWIAGDTTTSVCFAAYRYTWGMDDVEWIHVCPSMLLSPIYCEHFVLLVFLLVVYSAADS